MYTIYVEVELKVEVLTYQSIVLYRKVMYSLQVASTLEKLLSTVWYLYTMSTSIWEMTGAGAKPFLLKVVIRMQHLIPTKLL